MQSILTTVQVVPEYENIARFPRVANENFQNKDSNELAFFKKCVKTLFQHRNVTCRVNKLVAQEILFNDLKYNKITTVEFFF